MSRPGSVSCRGRRRIEKMLPTETFTSMLLDPSSGSNTNRYLPRGYSAGICLGWSISSLARPARLPLHSVVRTKISLLMMSSGFCTSPCTFTSPPAAAMCRVAGSPKAPKATERAMALQAMATSRISAFSSPLAPGKRRRCSMRYCVRVRRLESGMASPQASIGFWNTRLPSRSCGARVLRSSAPSTRSASANKRLAWRKRARSSALRTLRALAKCGWEMRRAK